ncbi:hypothetical protein [Stigmatella aurantiaca]|uniref:Lipoprotein n=1 Tax=Stigmatella aurantiaca (strain DW4/3-1) TaxID=378806 RepID=E3FVU5_STIAD|nr:hypothetical protein [Stigmatella aurantiaca]ADO73485.1 uncharacterized protein STAUR_5723 [Stigmatella aurantiaca DW4/3-1]
MNVKALAAVVGTLSLTALATGCASSKSAEATPASTDTSTQSPGSQAANPEQGAAGDTTAAPSAPKGEEGKCGEGKCGEGKCGEGKCGGKK